MTERLFVLATAPFEAARRIHSLPAHHPASRLHGHSFLARARSSLPGEPAELASALAEAVAPLDYSDLNQHLEQPDDPQLVRWLHQRLAHQGIDTLGIQSTRHQGVDLDAHHHTHLWRRFRFEAAHQLPNVPQGHQCGRMHGHGFEVILHARQASEQAPTEIDFDRLNEVWQPLQQQLHHHCLNDLRGLENPTSEMICRWLWQRIQPQLGQLSWISLYETATAGCHYDGEHFRIWKEQSFESALTLNPRPGQPARICGHSYLIRLHLTAPLDEIMGWTIDYGDVKRLFNPVYAALDHHRLNDLDGLSEPSSPQLVRWIRHQMAASLPQMDRIDLYETPGCGVLLSWGEPAPALPG